MKRTLTIIAITLLAALCMAVFVACGQSDSSLQKLPTPSRPEKDGTTVTWQDNPLYTDIVVCVDDEQFTTSETSFDITFAMSKGKTFEVKIKALGDGVHYADSDWSEALTVSPLRLSLEQIPDTYNYKIKKCLAAYGDIVLPEVYNGFPIVEIGTSAFRDCHDITSVTIPQGYTKISTFAFKNCEKLENIVIPDSVTRISGRAFENCESLKKLHISKYVTFNDSMHFPLSALEELTIDPENPKYKSDGNCLIRKSDNALLFANENSTIPSYVDKIAADAFHSDKIKSISIPNGVKQILKFAFDCINLRHMEIPASVTDIETSAFSYCSNLSEFVVADDNPVYKSDLGHIIRKSDNVLMFGCCGDIVLPDYITGIADYAFYGKKITQSALIIPKSVTWIGSLCFEFCKGLEYVYLPNTLKELKTCSFLRETNGKGQYIGGVRSLTIPEGCVNDAYTISYSAPECELGYDDGYPYVISYTYSARSIFSNNIPDRIFIYDETKDEIFGYPYRYGYTFGGFAATPNGSRITTPEEFQQTIFKEDGINKTKVYPIWIPNQTV